MAKYGLYRRVEANKGYKGIKGVVRLPGDMYIKGLESVDPKEAAYNYFAVRGKDFDYGIGVFTSPDALGSKYWQVYHSFVSSCYVCLNYGWESLGWPASGIEGEYDVRIKLSIPQDNQLKFEIEYGYFYENGDYPDTIKGSNSWTFNLPGLNLNGNDEMFRMVTALYFNNAAYMYTDWYNMKVITPSGQENPWTNAEINKKTSAEFIDGDMDNQTENPDSIRVTEGYYGYFPEKIFMYKNMYSPADLTKDGYVDIDDLNIIKRDYDKKGDPGWIPADINKDGRVSLKDLVYAARLYAI